jgi:hypothetical protein
MKGKVTQPNLCTYCGRQVKLTSDHVIPRAVWVGQSHQRPIFARSCSDCNWKSDESLLKSVMVLFDERLSEERAKELSHPKGRGDLRKLLSLSYGSSVRWEDHLALIQDWSKNPAYPDEKITRLFKKMFQGLRRHFLPKGEWTYIPADRFHVFTVRKNGGKYELFALPLQVGPNKGSLFPEELLPLEFTREGSFRDFRFGIIGQRVLELRYDRTWEGNELRMLCWIEME